MSKHRLHYLPKRRTSNTDSRTDGRMPVHPSGLPSFKHLPGGWKVIVDTIFRLFARRYRLLNSNMKTLPLVVSQQWSKLTRTPKLNSINVRLLDRVKIWRLVTTHPIVPSRPLSLQYYHLILYYKTRSKRLASDVTSYSILLKRKGVAPWINYSITPVSLQTKRKFRRGRFVIMIKLGFYPHHNTPKRAIVSIPMKIY